MTKKKIKFAINETLDNIVLEITEKLPLIKTRWEIHEETNIPYFSTHINGVSIEVHSDKVTFNINREGYEPDSRIFQNFSRKNKPLKIKIYESLCHRFNMQDDYKFYKRILTFINGYANLEKNKNGIQFTENTNSKEDC